jgi:multiple sugar transport system substrate-binding protein
MGLVAAAAALALIAGCGGGNSGGGTSAGGKVTLKVWAWTPDEKVFTALDKAFMAANPNITIEHVQQPYNSYFTLERSAMTAGKGPDVMEEYAGPHLFDYVRAYQPLAQLRGPTDAGDLIGWQYTSTQLKPNGTPYAYPWTGQGIHFYYNKALFKKAGLDPQKPPKTWDEFLGDCAALKKAGIVPVAAGLKDGYYGEWWGDTFGPQYMSDQELLSSYANPNWTNPAIIKGVSKLTELQQKGYLTPNAEGITLFPEAVNAFGAGKGAMILSLSSNTANWKEYSGDAIGAKNLGAFLPPVVSDGQWTDPKYDFGPGLAFGVTKWSSHAKEAARYLSFISNAQSQAKVFDLIGSIPNNKKTSLTTSNPVAKELSSWVKDAPKYVGTFTLIRAQPEAVFDQVVPLFVTGKMSVTDAMKKVQDAQAKLPPLPAQ